MSMYAVLKFQAKSNSTAFFGFIDLRPVELDQLETTSGEHMILGVNELDLATGEKRELVLKVVPLYQVSEKFDDIRYMNNLENSEFAYNGQYYSVSSKQKTPLKFYFKNKSQYFALENWMSDIGNDTLKNIVKKQIVSLNEKIQYLNETDYSFLNANTGDLFHYLNASDKENIQEQYIKFEYLKEFNAKNGVVAMCSVWDEKLEKFKSPVSIQLNTNFENKIVLKFIGQVYL